MARVDYDRQAVRYQAGRGVPLDHLGSWRHAVAPSMEGTTGPVLDIGAGTGIWTRAFGTWFDRPVIGVEPSSGMREIAVREGLPMGCSLVGGRCEAIPLGQASVGLAWMSTVVHHLSDLAGAADELHRVLGPTGQLLIRNSFPLRHDEIMLFAYFPAAKRAAETFPTVDHVSSVFADAGFVSTGLTRVREPAPPDLEAFRRWVVSMRHADSALAPLDDAAFAEGIGAIDAAIDAGHAPLPLGLDLLVLTKTG